MASQLAPSQVAFGRAVRQLRIQLELSQERLAELSNLHRNYVGSIERGERNVGLANIIRLAVALQVRPSELLALAEADPIWANTPTPQ